VPRVADCTVLVVNAEQTVELQTYVQYYIFHNLNFQERCEWQCQHQKCTLACSEICNREPCYEACPKKLLCGHPCVGFCGEPCPPQCRECPPEDGERKITDIEFGYEDEEDARSVHLSLIKL